MVYNIIEQQMILKYKVKVITFRKSNVTQKNSREKSRPYSV